MVLLFLSGFITKVWEKIRKTCVKTLQPGRKGAFVDRQAAQRDKL